jgi:hypothetical protein
MYDVFFISYDEPTADIHWQRLLDFAPGARRIHGVKGILAAHKAAAEQSNTAAFFVVDADAWLSDDWSFTSEFLEDIHIPYAGRSPANCVLVWRSRNPYNGLEYGYGGIKLMPKIEMIKSDAGVDVATSISDCFMNMDSVACETRFASSKWHAWRGAFRECSKLASAPVVQEQWLETWCTHASGEYSSEILAGATAGREYGAANRGNTQGMRLVNDYEWLKNVYEKSF